MSNSSILPLDRTLTGATSPSQNRPGSDCNKGVLRIPKSFSITEAPPADLFSVIARKHWEGYHSTAPAYWTKYYSGRKKNEKEKARQKVEEEKNMENEE